MNVFQFLLVGNFQLNDLTAGQRLLKEYVNAGTWGFADWQNCRECFEYIPLRSSPSWLLIFRSPSVTFRVLSHMT